MRHEIQDYTGHIDESVIYTPKRGADGSTLKWYIVTCDGKGITDTPRDRPLCSVAWAVTSRTEDYKLFWATLERGLMDDGWKLALRNGMPAHFCPKPECVTHPAIVLDY